MKKDLLEKCRAAAAKEGRSLSNWLEQLAKSGLPLILFLLAVHAPSRAIAMAGLRTLGQWVGLA